MLVRTRRSEARDGASDGPAWWADSARRHQTESLGRYERLLVAPRAVLGLVGVPLLDAITRPGVPLELAAVGLILVGASLYAHRRLRGQPTAAQLHRLSLQTLGADASAALLVLLALSHSPVSPAAILFPLVVFEAALKLGRDGVAVGALLLSLAVALRAVERMTAFGAAPRYPLIILIFGVSSLLAGLAMALRAEERARHAAAQERDRIRFAFRQTIEEALRNTGVEQATVDASDLERLVQLACQDVSVGPEVGRRLAKLLSPDPALARLTRRERESVELFAQGRSDREIAAELVVSAVTVRVHLSNAMVKLGVAGRPELVARLAQPRDMGT